MTRDGASLDGLRVLVVEDEYFLADDLKHLLKDHGAALVRLSGSIPDAMVQIKTDAFEIALLDLNIRGERAYAVADELQRHDLPFAFVTGYDRGAIPARFAGVPLWSKPFDPRQIIGEIQSLRQRTSRDGRPTARAVSGRSTR